MFGIFCHTNTIVAKLENYIKKCMCYSNNSFAAVAQLDRALGYGPGGSGFNS